MKRFQKAIENARIVVAELHSLAVEVTLLVLVLIGCLGIIKSKL